MLLEPHVLRCEAVHQIGIRSGLELGGAANHDAQFKDFEVIIPWFWLSVGVGAAFVLGAFAGLYPAWRASKLDPPEAVRPAA